MGKDKKRSRSSRSRSRSRDRKYSSKSTAYTSRNPSKSRSQSVYSNKYEKMNEKFNRDKSNQVFKISSGPVVFEGSAGAIIEKKDFQQPEPKQNKYRTQDNYQQSQSQQKKQNKNEEYVFDDDEYKAFEWKDLQEEADRYWYDQDEGEAYNEDREDQLFIGDVDKFRAMENQMEKMQKRQYSLKDNQKNEENQKWEVNRMMHSGFFQLQAQQNNLEETEDNRVQLMVHDFRPPFLDGKTIYTKQLETVSIVKDVTSDMAILAKKGSRVLKKQREQKERVKAVEKLKLAGSNLGNLLNVEKEKDEDDENDAGKEDQIIDEDGEIDYKKTNQYSASFLNKKQEAVSEFAKNKTIKEQREFLPVFSVRDELMNCIRENKVIIIVGETGSGKTTQLTQYLYEEGYVADGQTIGCTQPRRVAAVSVAKRVAEEMEVELGKEVGYTIRFEDNTTKKLTKIKYMTDGVLLRESLNDPDLEEYSAIIMDEAHERSLNTDVLFGILKQVAQRRRDIKIIITSATMNAQKFSEFFCGAEIFNIPGRTFPVREQYEKSAADDYVFTAVKKAIEIHIQQDMGDILIFMTGQEDIEVTCALIQQKMEELESNVPPMFIMPIYSQLRSEEQAKIFETSKNRKCIVATNIAETSLTLDGVRYVIDTGYCKLKVYNPKIGMDALQVTPISQANANQRKGRAGRTGPGVCYRLYSDTNFRADMLENNIPEIQRTNLANVVLLLKTLNIDNLLEFDFMDPPPQETILNSMYQLWVLGCLDELGRLTDLGRKMAQFPLDPPLSRMLISADELNCTEEVLTIVSMLSIPAIFYRPKGREEESDAAREKLYVPESDHLTLLNIYDQWKKHSYSGEWCKQCFIQYKSMKKVREVRSQIKDIAVQQGLELTSCGYDYDVVRKAITSAYFINACRIKNIGDYYNLRTGLPCKIHPSSALFTLGYAPDYAVYHDLVLTSKEYMHVVTTVDPYWLQEMGPMFFSVKESYGYHRAKTDIEKKGYQVMEQRIEDAKRMIEEQKQQEVEKKKKEQDLKENQEKGSTIFGSRQKKKDFKFKPKSNKNQSKKSMLSFVEEQQDEEDEEECII